MAFDSVAYTPGSGGNFAFDSFNDGGTTRVMPYSALAYGAIDGPYTNVSTSNGLPVAQQGTWSVTADTELPAAAALADATANPTTPVIGGCLLLFNGTTWDRVRGDTTNGVDVDVTRVSGNVTVINAGTFAVQAAQSGTWTVTGSGGTFPVTDSGGSLTVDNAGTFAVQVDGAALTALQLIDNLVLAEDAVHGSGDPGVMVLSVRKDSATALAGTDGDYQSLITDASGRLHVAVGNTVTVGSHDVTNAGTFAVQAAQSGTWTVQPGNTANTTPWLVSIHDGTNKASVRDLGSSDALNVAICDGSGNQITSFGGGTQYTEGDTDSTITGTAVLWEDTGDTLRAVSAAKPLPVGDAGGSLTVDNAGTFAVQVDGAALTALQLIDNIVLAEDAAHGSGDPGVQALAVRNDSDASLCGTTGDYTPLQVDANGFLKVNIKAGAGSGGTASTDDAAFTAASGSGTPMMGFVTSDSVDSGDVGVVGMLANRQLKVTLYDSGGVELAVGGGTQYTEDAAAAANPVGNALIVVRDDARGGSLTSTDGDNVALRGNNAGELYVKHTDTVAVTQSGTWNISTLSSISAVIPGTGATNLGKAEDAAHTSADTGVAALAVRRDTPVVGSGTDGDYSTLNVDADGRLYVNVHDGGNAITVDGTVAATQSGTWNIGTVTPGTGATNLGKAEDAAHTTGDVGVMGLTVRQDSAAALGGTDGDYQPLITDSSGRLHVTVGNTVTVGSHAVTNAGTFAVQVDGAALTALQLIDDPVFADDAAFTPGTSKVFAVGFQADETATDSVDEGDIGCPRMTLDRKVYTVAEQETDVVYVGGSAVTVKRAAIAAASSGENTLVAAVASKKIRVLSLAVIAASAVNVYFNNATDGAVFGGSTNKMNLAANGGFVLPHNAHGWFQTGTNNEALRLNLSAAVSVSGGLTYIEV